MSHQRPAQDSIIGGNVNAEMSAFHQGGAGIMAWLHPFRHRDAWASCGYDEMDNNARYRCVWFFFFLVRRSNDP